MTTETQAQPKSTPTLTEFDPRRIPFQFQVIKDIRKNFDYSLGVHEVLLSGSVGSAKSLLMAHLGITHCLMYHGAALGLGRLSMPALKGTIFQTILDHLPEGMERVVRVNETSAVIKLPNRSIIRSHSWQDKKYKKVRSFPYSSFLIEELTENNEEQSEAYEEIFMRCNRLPNIPETFLCSATNPDDPTHWVYRRFMGTQMPTRHVYYSKTAQNPFLKPSYIQNLRDNLDPQMAKRMLDGLWVPISQDTIYYMYNEAVNYVPAPWKILKDRPVFWSHDWNIGSGKPMSSICAQVDDRGAIHFFKEFVIEGIRTHDVCDEMDAQDILWDGCHLVIMGDATGRHKDTRSNKTDFEIVEKWAQNNHRKMKVTLCVPTVNPPIRTRHNLVNSHWLNDNGKIRAYIHAPCAKANEGMKMTKFKKGAELVEDDSFEGQHVTTAMGYLIYAFRELFLVDPNQSGMISR